MSKPEPEDKNSPMWREWHIRHTFGGVFVAMIKIAAKDEDSMNILDKFIMDIRRNYR